MEKKELIKLATDILNGVGKTEEENDELLQKFLDNVPDPRASDLFFSLENKDLTTEEIVNRALSYQPFQL